MHVDICVKKQMCVIIVTALTFEAQNCLQTKKTYEWQVFVFNEFNQ